MNDQTDIETADTLPASDLEPVAEVQADKPPPPGAVDEKGEPQTYIQFVRTKFSADELEERVDQLRAAREDRDKLALSKRDVAKKLKKATALVEQLATDACEGAGDVAVRCVDRQIFETNTVQTVRVDTGEIVRERAMDGKDRQAGLFTGRKKKKTDKPAKRGKKGH